MARTQKKLIVNADDFGLCPAVTDGIWDACQQGIVRSTSLMVTGQDAERAVALARTAPDRLAVGVHLTLGGARPTLPADRVPSLIDADGLFLKDYGAFLKRWATGRICLGEVKLELTAQLERARALGIEPTHVDSHQHLHLLPGIFGVVLELCRRFAIPRLRIPATGRTELSLKPATLGLEVLAQVARRVRRPTSGPQVAEHFRGRAASCRLDEAALLDIVRTLEPGTTELMCHPGRQDDRALAEHPWGLNWQAERQALTSPRVLHEIERLNITLVQGI
jgi:chitin disaccharide deacetylase